MFYNLIASKTLLKQFTIKLKIAYKYCVLFS
nr:MAG TPA: hypothetical protein [Caudoviricetes sp.]